MRTEDFNIRTNHQSKYAVIFEDITNTHAIVIETADRCQIGNLLRERYNNQKKINTYGNYTKNLKYLKILEVYPLFYEHTLNENEEK